MNGWMGKIVTIDLGSRKQETVAVDDETRRRYLGGRGLGGQAVYRPLPGSDRSLRPKTTP